MIKIALLNTVAILSLSVTACNAESSNLSSRTQALSQDCKALSSKTGRDYQPVVGRYLGSKSKIQYPPSHTNTTWYSYQMVFLGDNNEELSIHSGADRENFDQFLASLSKALGEDRLEEDTKEKFGICTYRNNVERYTGMIETFIKMGE